MSEMDLGIIADLAAFADLGTEPPRAVESGGRSVVRLFRNGRRIELVFDPSGRIEERDEVGEHHYSDFRALLAAPNFGDLGRWADAQNIILKTRVEQERIPVFGSLSGVADAISIDEIDTRLAPEDNGGNQRVHILLIDGPAGIGKTALIRKLAYNRAADYRQQRRPLVLHVESRGRMLQNIMDLMAFSLQTLRVTVTYDQIPTLVRRGLITLAIDGFDELGDPNGYELAWAQVNELVDHNIVVVSIGLSAFIGGARQPVSIGESREAIEESPGRENR